MKVRVISEIQSARGIVPAGSILEISPAAFEKLKGQVEALPEHYCLAGACWCSAKLPGRNHPEECARISCEYFIEAI